MKTMTKKKQPQEEPAPEQQVPPVEDIDQDDDFTQTMSTRLPVSLVREIIKLSKSERRGRSNMLAVLIEEAMVARGKWPPDDN